MINHSAAVPRAELRELHDLAQSMSNVATSLGLVKAIVPPISQSVDLAWRINRLRKYTVRAWGKLSGREKNEVRELIISFKSANDAIARYGWTDHSIAAVTTLLRWPFAMLPSKVGLLFVRDLEPLVMVEDARGNEAWSRIRSIGLDGLSETLRIGPENYDASKTVTRDMEKTPRRIRD